MTLRRPDQSPTWQTLAAIGATFAVLLTIGGVVFASGSRISALETSVADTQRQQARTDRTVEEMGKAMQSIDRHLSRIEGKLGIEGAQ